MMTPAELSYLAAVRAAIVGTACLAPQEAPAAELFATAARDIVSTARAAADLSRERLVELLVFAAVRFCDLQAIARNVDAEAALETLTRGIAHARVV